MRVCLLILAASCVLAKSYSVDAIVLALDPATQTMLVSHRPIPRYMPAMVMPFRVEHLHDLDALYPGARVQFDLVIANRHSLARNVRKSAGADADIAASRDQLPIGAALPAFQLTDQLGRTVEAPDLRGKWPPSISSTPAARFPTSALASPPISPRCSAASATNWAAT